MQNPLAFCSLGSGPPLPPLRKKGSFSFIKNSTRSLPEDHAEALNEVEAGVVTLMLAWEVAHPFPH